MEGVFKVAVVMLTVLGTPMVIFYVLGPLAKALGRRLEGAVGADAADLQALRTEVEQLRELHPRVAELEERLDFAERALLSARGGTAQLSEGDHAAR
jgi:predicted phage tail protein